MTPEETSLARLLVALPGWTWRGGTAWIADTDCPLCHGYGGFRWHEADGSENGESCPCSGRMIDGSPTWTGAIPDLLDPTGATAGILLGMLAAIAPPEVYFGVGAVRVTWSDTGSADGPRLGVAAARALVAIGRCA